MTDKLKKTYFSLLVPSLFGFAIASWAKAYDFIEIGSANFIAIAGPLIFILCIVLAIAFPIFYRALFAHKSRDLINLSENKFLRFERTLIDVVMITPYLALAAYFLELPRFYTASAILIGLYAVYYFYPSKTRIGFEKRIFRVK
jgi:Ca2+/Na+ antiporter